MYNKDIDTLYKLIDDTTKLAWELHRKLGSTSYDNKWEQFRDMEKLGGYAKIMRLYRMQLMRL